MCVYMCSSQALNTRSRPEKNSYEFSCDRDTVHNNISTNFTHTILISFKRRSFTVSLTSIL